MYIRLLRLVGNGDTGAVVNLSHQTNFQNGSTGIYMDALRTTIMPI